MKLIYTYHTVADLDAATYAKLHRLNHRNGGLMQRHFAECRKVSKTAPSFANQAHVCIARTADGEIHGWTLVFNHAQLWAELAPNPGLRAHRYNTYVKPTKNRWYAYFYVRRSSRRLGIGSNLFTCAREIRKTFKVYRYNTLSTSFFKSQGR